MYLLFVVSWNSLAAFSLTDKMTMAVERPQATVNLTSEWIRHQQTFLNIHQIIIIYVN